MPYLNPLAASSFEVIENYLTSPFVNKKKLFQAVYALDYDAICALSREGSTLLHDALRLGVKTPLEFCFIMKLLIEKAIEIDTYHLFVGCIKKSAVEWLLTKQNGQGQSLFYQALFMHADPFILQAFYHWLNWGLHEKHVSIEQYLSTHQNAENMIKLVSGEYSGELNLCLNELLYAIPKQWISPQQYKALFFPLGLTKKQQLKMLIETQRSETIKAFFLWQHIDFEVLLKQNDLGYTLIDSLIEHEKCNHVKAVLTAVCDSIDNGAYPTSVIKTILLRPSHSGFRLLDRAIKTGRYELIELVMNTAEVAFQKQWIDTNEYNQFLIGHENHDFGFSPLHEILLLKQVDIESTLLYINKVLQGVVSEVISLEEFRSLLTQNNSAGYRPIHQAINNHSLDKTHLFLNLYKWIFSQLDYDHAILSCSRDGKKIGCFGRHENAKKINEMVSNERDLARQRRDHVWYYQEIPRTPFTLIKPFPWSSHFINFIALINQTLSFEKFQLGYITCSFDRVDVVTSNIDSSSPYEWVPSGSCSTMTEEVSEESESDQPFAPQIDEARSGIGFFNSPDQRAHVARVDLFEHCVKM